MAGDGLAGLHDPNRQCITVKSTGNISLIRDISVRMAIGQFERSFTNAEFSAAQNLEFMAAADPEMMTSSFMAPNGPGEHHSDTESVDNSYGYTQQYDT